MSTSSGPSRSSPILSSTDERDSQLLTLAVAGEAGLAVLALAASGLVGTAPLEQLRPSWGRVLWGVLATIPLLTVLWWIVERAGGRLRELAEFVTKHLGPLIAGRSVLVLGLLSALAGFAEELLFRGVIQAGLGRLVPAPVALIVSSALFGLAHFATSTYAVLAGVMGVYLGLLYQAQENLFAPMVTHGLYDLVALVLVARRYSTQTTAQAE